MLDWLTLRLSTDYVEDKDALRTYVDQRPHLARFIPATGEVEWTTTMRESSRSDSHAVTVHVGADIEIAGSPARSMGQRHNVFGTLDITEAARAHVAAAEKVLGFSLPQHWSCYRVTRVDVTFNYALGGLPEVRQALAYLRQSEGGRYKLRAQAESVYWSPGSRMRAGKAYAKGPHLRHLQDKGKGQAEPWELDLAEGLLRLELRLGGEWWRRQRQDGKRWWQFSASDWTAEHEGYFAELIGTCEVAEMVDVRQRLEEVAPTEGQAAAAHRTWCVIQSVGHQQAKDSMPRATWFRHVRLLKQAGLGWGDIAAGQVVPIRRRPLVLSQPVQSWDDVRKAV
ncbi:hypothetical protein H0Z60_12885 [Ectothiorhodospiraceae bacterium WFHF3C12]|nr:hypothetical protein [Ectothiorhodospiraceae bacterium WFHF3C12]